MEKIFFTLTGTRFFYGHEFMEPGMKVLLVKEPDNEEDSEAIRVEMEGLGKVGYVANSVRTVQGKSYSAGRLYDKIDDTALATVVYVLDRCVLCTLDDSIITF